LPYANLFEGNIIQNYMIDHYWGPAGPYNTFFRNRTELYGIVMTNSNGYDSNLQNHGGQRCSQHRLVHGQLCDFRNRITFSTETISAERLRQRERER
jgi:hypothetical protein